MAITNIIAIAQVKPIKVNEGAPFHSVNLATYIENPDQQPIGYQASLVDGGELPAWLSFSEQGVLKGRPPKGAAQQGSYLIKVLAIAESNKLEFPIEIKVYVPKTADEIAAERKAVWEELAKQGVLPPNWQEVIERPITAKDIYYLLARYASFTLWNADDRRLADNGKLVTIPEQSEKFNVYDFDVCLVTTPKDLYDSNRTLGDALQTAKAMVKSAHTKKWNVEFGGFDRMADAAWYEAYDLNQASTNNHNMEVRNYEPAEITAMTAKQQTSKPSNN